MSIVYDPKKMLKKIAPESKVRRLISGKVSLKRTALSFIDRVDFLDRKRVTEVALKTVKGYKERIAQAVVKSGYDRAAGKEVKSEILDDPKQLIQRVENEVVLQISTAIKETYSGERYEWLPSDAEEPDPEHQLNYGKVFTVGEGEMPGERYGCRCGMNILVNETQLEL